jgi:hypothetical protein
MLWYWYICEETVRKTKDPEEVKYQEDGENE